jgi:hypothetical protein
MKTYTKVHPEKKALDTHLSRIKKRGGIVTTKKTRAGTLLEYHFPENKTSKAKTETKTKKKKKYDVISPDGFSIRIGVPLFSSIKERDEYFKKWKYRYKGQGYYSSNTGRIPLDDLKDYCQFIEV